MNIDNYFLNEHKEALNGYKEYLTTNDAYKDYITRLTKNENMKKLLILLLLVPVISQAQKQTGGVQIGPTASFFKNGGSAYGGEIEGLIDAGKLISLGMGFKVMKFEKVDNPYIPVYVSFRCNVSSPKMVYYFNLNPGYGIYKYGKSTSIYSGSGISTASVTSTGGLYAGIGFGIHGKGTSPYFNLQYSLYSFKSTVKLDRSSTVAYSNINAFTATVGIWISKKS